MTQISAASQPRGARRPDLDQDVLDQRQRVVIVLEIMPATWGAGTRWPLFVTELSLLRMFWSRIEQSFEAREDADLRDTVRATIENDDLDDGLVDPAVALGRHLVVGVEHDRVRRGVLGERRERGGDRRGGRGDHRRAGDQRLPGDQRAVVRDPGPNPCPGDLGPREATSTAWSRRGVSTLHRERGVQSPGPAPQRRGR